MNKEAADVLKHIADKLDVPVQQIWAGLMAYAPFTYYQWLTSVVVATFFLVAALVVIFWALRKADEKSEHFFGVALIAFFCAIPPVMTLAISGVGGMSEALAARHAPEAWASKYILRQVGR